MKKEPRHLVLMPATCEPEFQQLDLLGQLDPWDETDTDTETGDPDNVIRFPLERIRSYQEYLASPEWQETREDALREARHRCRICNCRHQLEVHHRTYDRIGRERPDDLTVLCRPCHHLFHEHGRLVRSA